MSKEGLVENKKDREEKEISFSPFEDRWFVLKLFFYSAITIFLTLLCFTIRNYRLRSDLELLIPIFLFWRFGRKISKCLYFIIPFFIWIIMVFVLPLCFSFYHNGFRFSVMVFSLPLCFLLYFFFLLTRK